MDAEICEQLTYNKVEKRCKGADVFSTLFIYLEVIALRCPDLLLDDVALLLGVNISDLRLIPSLNTISLLILLSIKSENYSFHVWNDAVNYLLETNFIYISVDEMKDSIRKRLDIIINGGVSRWT